MAKINSKQKGSRFERKLAGLFREWWGGDYEIYRTPMSGGWGTRKVQAETNSSGDISTADPSFPFCVEAKHVEGWNLEQLLTSPKCDFYSWLDQTIEETPTDKIPLLLFTKNRFPIFLAIFESDLRKKGLEPPALCVTIRNPRYSSPVVVTDASWLWASPKAGWANENT